MAAAADWTPTATLPLLRRRAELLHLVRNFFAERSVLEVETPLLQRATVTDLHLASLSTRTHGPDPGELFLQTSPEFAMKRLLAAGSGPIYQICKAFRDGEAGPRHNPEFTLLEWYRPGFDHHALMAEVAALLCAVLGEREVVHLTYGEWFERELGIDPHAAPTAALLERLRATPSGASAIGIDPGNRDEILGFLVGHELEARLPPAAITFVFDYPASQAALARTRAAPAGQGYLVAERFEAYAGSLELANGYHELADPAEQRRRFQADLAARRGAGLPVPPIDQRLLHALDAGLPDCAGVALGFDRLVMAATGATRLEQVVAFPIDRA